MMIIIHFLGRNHNYSSTYTFQSFINYQFILYILNFSYKIKKQFCAFALYINKISDNVYFQFSHITFVILLEITTYFNFQYCIHNIYY